jgi:hypothetical protein
MMQGKHEIIEAKFHSLLTLALDGGEWPALQSSSFTPGKRTPCIYWTRGWVAPELAWTWWKKKSLPLLVYPVYSQSLCWWLLQPMLTM